MRFGKFLLVAALLWAPHLVLAALPEPPPLSEYGRLPSLSNLSLSPSGQRLAFINDTGEQRRLVIAETGGKALMVEDIGDLKLWFLAWAGDDFVVAFLRSTQQLGYWYGTYKEELGNMVVIDLQHRSVRWPLTRTRVVNAAFGYFGVRQHEGRWGAYVGTYLIEDLSDDRIHLDDANRRLTRVDLETGELTTVDAGTRGGRSWLLDAQGNVMASDRYNPQTQRWTLYAGAHADRQLVDLDSKFGIGGILGLGTEPDKLLYSRVDDAGRAHYMQIPLAGGQASEILDNLTVASVHFDQRSHQLIGVTLQDQDRTLVMFDTGIQSRVDAATHSFQGVPAFVSGWSGDFVKLAVFTEGNTDPGTSWLLDLATKKGSQLGRRYPGVRPEQVGPYRLVRYQAADGLELDGVLTLPPPGDGQAKNLPLVVLPHGGPAAYDILGFDWWAQAFASRGYAVWQPNFRGSMGGGNPGLEAAGYGEFGRKMQTDISDGVAELARQGVVDPARACIVGGSYGGYAALAGVTLQQHLYRCAVSVAGISDLKFMVGDKALASERYWLRYLGAKSFNDDVLAALSPVRLARQADAPILLIHGKDDTVVPIEQSEKMRRALESAGKPVEMIRMEGEDHWLSHARTRTAMLEAAVAFVLRHNPPGVVAH